ncbi:MAG: TolC family protein [Spirochaetaceae bacterium]
MKRPLIALSILAFVLFPALPIDGDPLILTEEGAVDRALEYNLGLAANRQELAGSRRRAETAWNVLVPEVTASAGLQRTNEATAVLPPGEEYRLTAVGGVEGRLALSLAAIEGIRTAEMEYRTGAAGYRESAAAVEQEIRKSFYNLILLEEQLAVAVSSVETAEAGLAQARADYENGFEPELTLRQAQVSLQTAVLNAERRRAAVADARETFKRLLGIEQEVEIALRGSIRLPERVSRDLDSLTPEESLGGRFDIQTLDAQIARQESLNQANALNARTPTLTLSAGWNPTLADPFNPDNTVNDEWVDRGSVGITLSLGLDDYLPFSASSVAVQAGRRSAESLRLQRQDALESARNEVDSLLRSLESSRVALESLELSLELATEVYTLTEEAYDEGAVSFVELLEAEEDLRDARSSLLSEQYRHLAALIDLEYATNRHIRGPGKGRLR